MKEVFKRERGITLVALVITVAIILILTNVVIYNAASNLRTTKLQNMQADIENLRDKVSNYYSQYGKIPANTSIEYTNTSNINSISSATDTGPFYVIDLAAMENVTLNYGKDYEKIRTGEATTQQQINQLTDLYIINADSHNIFYVAGIEIDGETFYTDYSAEDADKVAVDIKDIKVLPADGSWSDEKQVNTPVIKDDMELVKWDEKTSQFVPDNTNSSYDYKGKEEAGDNNESKWANAKVTIDGVESYFVWIPRYEYKIDSNSKTIDVKFIPTSQTKADAGYIIHPAFTSNVDNGGWRSELPGIWVGKYESARSDSEGATQGTSTTIKVQPGVTSWRSITIGDMYNYAKAYSTNLNSHMLKNSEWGAVAYLTHSQYGRNGTEVTQNTDPSYLTASGDIVKYSNQSSTGNETGIYGLSGGASEYVAAYYNGSTSSDLTNYGGSFASQNGSSTEYATAYTGTSASSAYKPGDATYETSGWHSDYAGFVDSYGPFFSRGGRKPVPVPMLECFTSVGAMGLPVVTTHSVCVSQYNNLIICLRII